MSFLGSAQLDGGLRHLSSSSSHQTFYPLCVPRLKHSIWPILVLGKSCVRSVGCSFSMKYKMFQNIKKRRDLKSVRTGFSTLLWLSPGLPDNVWNVTEQRQWLQTQQNPPPVRYLCTPIGWCMLVRHAPLTDSSLLFQHSPCSKGWSWKVSLCKGLLWEHTLALWLPWC